MVSGIHRPRPVSHDDFIVSDAYPIVQELYFTESQAASFLKVDQEKLHDFLVKFERFSQPIRTKPFEGINSTIEDLYPSIVILVAAVNFHLEEGFVIGFIGLLNKIRGTHKVNKHIMSRSE